MRNTEITAEQQDLLKKQIIYQAEQAELLRTFKSELGKCVYYMKLELEVQNEEILRQQLLKFAYNVEDEGPPCSSSSTLEPEESDSTDNHTHNQTMDTEYYCNPISNLKR